MSTTYPNAIISLTLAKADLPLPQEGQATERSETPGPCSKELDSTRVRGAKARLFVTDAGVWPSVTTVDEKLRPIPASSIDLANGSATNAIAKALLE